MASINEARKLYPELSGLSDNDAVDILHQNLYADLPREQVADALGVKAVKLPPEPAKPRSWGAVATDVGISALKGAIAVPEAVVGIADLATGGQAGKLAHH